MKKIIYHGSERIIEWPIYGYGKRHNDYGLGFYCTEDGELAKEWSVDSDRSGWSNRYEIETGGLNILNLNGKDYCILHWLGVLLKNRHFDVQASLAAEAKEYIMEHFAVPFEGVDAVVGYRADDSYFSFAQDFISGGISYRQLGNAMHLGGLGEQFVLISREAFKRIRFLDAEAADRETWYARKELRDRRARGEYFRSERSRRQRGDLYITTILDEEIGPEDDCL